MATVQEENLANDMVSPGGNVFGIQGWSWGEQRPTHITFLTNGTCRVIDQHGRLIRGVVLGDGVPIYFDRASHAQVVKALLDDQTLRIDVIHEMNETGQPCQRCKGTGLSGERPCNECWHKPTGRCTGIKKTITCVGWPQLPYEQLKLLNELPPTPITELYKIKNTPMRKDALRIRREVDKAKAAEQQGIDEEDSHDDSRNVYEQAAGEQPSP